MFARNLVKLVHYCLSLKHVLALILSVSIFVICISVRKMYSSFQFNLRLSDVPADARLLVPELLEHMNWTDGEIVMDYGSADGVTAYNMLLPKVYQHHGHLYCVEKLRKHVEKARITYPDSRITYGMGDLTEDIIMFPYSRLKFDKVFAIYVFHVVHDLGKLLERFKDLMRPGALLGFSALTENNPGFKVNLEISKSEIFKEYMPDYESKQHPNWSLGVNESDWEHKFEKLVNQSGFKVMYLRKGNLELPYSSMEYCIESILYWSTIYEHVPQKLIPELKDGMKLLFSAITGLPEDAKKFTLTNEYIVGVLKRI